MRLVTSLNSVMQKEISHHGINTISIFVMSQIIIFFNNNLFTLLLIFFVVYDTHTKYIIQCQKEDATWLIWLIAVSIK